MKLLFKDYLNGWWMTGILSKKLNWFFGYSRIATIEEQAELNEYLKAMHMPENTTLFRKRNKWYVLRNI